MEEGVPRRESSCERREKIFQDMLNDDCLRLMSEYLTVHEFRNFCSTSKEIRHRFSLQSLWRTLCFRKWNWKGNIFLIPKDFDGQALYASASPICHQILLPDDSGRIKITSDDLMIEYNGTIGESNQSVRTSQHFPPLHPHDVERESLTSWAIRMVNYLVCGCKSSQPILSSYPQSHRFFFTPYCDSLQHSYHIEPRQVAYYEITILASSSPALPSLFNDDDCIAIGLSTEAFSLVKLMPGWDASSYGYHSDDGAIFHGRGSPYSSYGPRFGVGDVVGCGLRYDTSEIFFTLNGKHLGTAFENIAGRLYPTVGLDARVKVNFNFGLSPFRFPLQELSKEH
jgi:hypothetical protein